MERKIIPTNTMYGVSDNVWINTQVFHRWFEKFCNQVTETPPLIYHGYLSHVSMLLIEKARKKDITILKLLPHVTHKIQPLDVSCFGPLKRAWTELLNERMNVLGTKESISKSLFADLLSQVWYKSFSETNIISWFRATGIFSTNRDKQHQTLWPTTLQSLSVLDWVRETRGL